MRENKIYISQFFDNYMYKNLIKNFSQFKPDEVYYKKNTFFSLTPLDSL